MNASGNNGEVSGADKSAPRPADADPPPPRLTGITIGADHLSWAGAGFELSGSGVEVAGVRIQLESGPHGVPTLSFDRLPGAVDHLDGIELGVAAPAGAGEHPNGVFRIDQVVVATPDFERTAEQLARLGLPLKREAVRVLDEDEGGEVRQGFVRAGGPVIELIHTDKVPEGSAHVWGLGFVSARFDEAVAELDGIVGKPRPAVQKGRRIVTFSRDAGLGLPVVMLDPEPGFDGASGA